MKATKPIVIALFLSAPGCVLSGEGIPCLSDDNCPSATVCEQSICVPGQAPELEPPGPQEPPQPPPNDPDEAVTPVQPGIGLVAVPPPPPPPAPGQAPDARPAYIEVLRGSETIIEMEADEFDGDRLEFRITRSPANGELVHESGAIAVYTPQLGFTGTDDFTFEVRDVDGASQATVSIAVLPNTGGLEIVLGALETLNDDEPLRVSFDTTMLEPGSVPSFFNDAGETLAADIGPWVDGKLDAWLQPTASVLRVVSDSPTPQPVMVWANYRAVFHLDDGAANAAEPLDGAVVDAVPVPSPIGGALEFDGENAWVDLGDDVDTLQSVPAAYMSAWVYPTARPIESSVIVAFSKGSNDTISRAQLSMGGDGRARVYGSSRDSDVVQQLETSDNDLLPLDTWTWVAAVIDYSNNQMRMFINGDEVDLRTRQVAGQNFGTGTDFANQTEATPSRQAAIGSQDDGSALNFAGKIDEVRVAAVAPSSEEIGKTFLSMRADRIVETGARLVAEHSAESQSDWLIAPAVEAAPGDLYLLFVEHDGVVSIEQTRGLGLRWLPLAASCAPNGKTLRAFFARGEPTAGDLEVELSGAGESRLVLTRYTGALRGAPSASAIGSRCDAGAVRWTVPIERTAWRSQLVSAVATLGGLDVEDESVAGDLASEPTGLLFPPSAYGAITVELR